MKRITLSLSEELAAALAQEARRRRVSMSRINREALELKLGGVVGERCDLPFVALGRSGHRNTARDMEEIMEREWTIDRDR